MLRDVVGNFLETLTEREFDGPLVAILSTRGFTDVHFIHGAFEFGKDVVAKKADPNTGVVRQYVIQSKAGDIGVPEWRAVRPQLEECEYNTLGHPSFDATLPRIAVLMTTGRLKGGAPADAAEYRKSVEARGLADLEIWDKSDLIDWICEDPELGIAGETVQVGLMSVLTNVLDKGVTDRRLENYARCWLPPAGGNASRAAIEAAILVNGLLRVRRLDLALGVAHQLMRATASDPDATTGASQAAQRLILGLASRLLDQIEPLLQDPLDLARYTVSQLGQLNYLVICCRISEAFALGRTLAAAMQDEVLTARFQAALTVMAKQPGSSRPPSDLFATSVVLVTVVLQTFDRAAAVDYVRRAARWLLDRHDDDLAGLGLAALTEDEQTTAARLFGGALESTTLEPRTSSYLATTLLDLALFLELEDLYETLLVNFRALRIVPETTNADESKAYWARGGPEVWPVPNVGFEPWATQAALPLTSPPADPMLVLLLTAACRSRHYRAAWGEITDSGP